MLSLSHKLQIIFMLLAAGPTGRDRCTIPAAPLLFDNSAHGYRLPVCFVNADPVTYMAITPPETVSRTDPYFRKGQQLGTPLMKYTPYAITGFAVSFGYNLSSVNGATVINISGVAASLIGFISGCSWTTLSTSYSISGPIVHFYVKGKLNYSGFWTIYKETVQFYGAYNTTNGFYSLTRK